MEPLPEHSPAPIRIGTRASALARWQAEWVAARLTEAGHAVELVPISTRGDRDQSQPLSTIPGGDGLFTKELQRALLADQIDLAVHSLKDLPTLPVEGLALGAVPSRAPNGDVLISSSGQPFERLPKGSVIGTGSLRRIAQLRHARPDVQVAGIRGNVDTRLRKLEAGDYDALVLAEAGLQRLGLADKITQVLPKSLMLPAVGQGALGLELRADDATTRAAIAPLDDATTRAAVLAERAMLAHLSGGCLAPVGAWCRIEDGRLRLEGVVLSSDGARRLSADGSGAVAAPEDLGRSVADDLLAQGAGALIAAARQQS